MKTYKLEGETHKGERIFLSQETINSTEEMREWIESYQTPFNLMQYKTVVVTEIQTCYGCDKSVEKAVYSHNLCYDCAIKTLGRLEENIFRNALFEAIMDTKKEDT